MQVKNEERASSIISTISSSSTTTTTSQGQWRTIQKELESVGITAAQLNANWDMVLSILNDAFKEDVPENSSVTIKGAFHEDSEGCSSVKIESAGQLTRFLSSILTINKKKKLLAAAAEGNTEKAKILLFNGASINVRDSMGCAPLDLAVYRQHLAMVKLLLSHNADVNRADVDWFAFESDTPKAKYPAYPSPMAEPPLLNAISNHCNMEIIKLLLDHGANVNQRCSDRTTTFSWLSADVTDKPLLTTALGMAIDQASSELAELLVRYGCNVNQACPGTPLSLAVEREDLNIVKLLLRNDAYVDASALQIAVRMQNIEYLQLLLARPENVSATEANLSTLALEASKLGKKDTLRFLLDKGVDINTTAPAKKFKFRRVKAESVEIHQAGKESLLWLAAAGGHLGSLCMLLEKGADIEQRAFPEQYNQDERRRYHNMKAEHRWCRKMPPPDYVRKCTAVQVAVAQDHRECVRALVHYGASLDAWVDCGTIPQRLLHFVIKKIDRSEEIIHFLTDLGADVNIEDNHGRTALFVDPITTSSSERIYRAQILVAKGAKINHQDEQGITPLHSAVSAKRPHKGRPPDDERYPDYDFIDFLLVIGADPNAKDREGRTPLHCAGIRRHQRTFELLLKAGGKSNLKDNEGLSAQDYYDKV